MQFASVLVPFTNQSSRAAARTEIDRISRDIAKNANKFDEYVQRGQASGLSYRSTTAGILKKNAQARSEAGIDFINGAFALNQGTVSDVLEIPEGSAAGFYLIKITAKYPLRFLGLDDIIMEFQQPVRAYIRAELQNQRQQEVLLKAQQETVVELRKGNPFKIFDSNLGL